MGLSMEALVERARGIPGLPAGARTRIAPTPSGVIHAGNLLNFMLTWVLARAAGGTVLLRIDDLDRDRVRDDYVEDIFGSLHAAGIDWDEGPKDAKDLAENWSQYHRRERYLKVIEELRATGLLYACNCSRKEVQAVSSDGNYPGTCRNERIPLDTPGVAWRYALPEGTKVQVRDLGVGSRTVHLNEVMNDPVLRQKNGEPAYQVASLVDDVDHRIQLIVRGEDLFPSTAFQLHLAGVLSFSTFLDVRSVHHRLITDATGHKLSKSIARGPAPKGAFDHDIIMLYGMIDQLLDQLTQFKV